MQIHRLSWRVRGFARLAELAVSCSMLHDTAEKRLSILKFWKEHGLKPTVDAFAVSRRTLYRWQADLRRGREPSALTPRSTAPKKRRVRAWPQPVVDAIRALRDKHPNLGKDKIHRLLETWCKQEKHPCPSVSTIGRLIADAPDKMRCVPQKIDRLGKRKPIKRCTKLRKPKDLRAGRPGQWSAVDTIERHQYGLRRYLLTMVDAASCTGLAFATNSHTATTAKHFLRASQEILPWPIEAILSDNGSEFKGAFDQALQDHTMPHWHTYPNCPKMNPQAERFNRTIQEEFVDYHEELLFTDLDAFNRKLTDWLLWYNTERPHYTHGQIPPMQFVAENFPECHMYWTHTSS